MSKFEKVRDVCLLFTKAVAESIDSWRIESEVLRSPIACHLWSAHAVFDALWVGTIQ